MACQAQGFVETYGLSEDECTKAFFDFVDLDDGKPSEVMDSYDFAFKCLWPPTVSQSLSGYPSKDLR